MDIHALMIGHGMGITWREDTERAYTYTYNHYCITNHLNICTYCNYNTSHYSIIHHTIINHHITSNCNTANGSCDTRIASCLRYLARFIGNGKSAYVTLKVIFLNSGSTRLRLTLGFGSLYLGLTGTVRQSIFLIVM